MTDEGLGYRIPPVGCSCWVRRFGINNQLARPLKVQSKSRVVKDSRVGLPAHGVRAASRSVRSWECGDTSQLQPEQIGMMVGGGYGDVAGNAQSRLKEGWEVDPVQPHRQLTPPVP